MANATLDDQDDVIDLADDGNGENDTLAGTEREDDGNQLDPETPAATTEAAQEEEERRNGSRMVPIARFNEVNERMKELQTQVAALAAAQGTPQPTQPQVPEQQPPAEPEVDLADLRKKHHNALVEGRDDEAIELQAKIDDEILNRATQNAMNRMAAQQSQREQQAAMQTFQQVVQQIEADYPQLDPKSDLVDPDAILFVRAKRDALMQAGASMTDAVQQASDAAASMFGFATAPKPTHTAATTAENRKREALLRNAQAAQAQPPQMGGTGNRATAPQRVDVSKMSEAEFEALPESEKARLRGD